MITHPGHPTTNFPGPPVMASPRHQNEDAHEMSNTPPLEDLIREYILWAPVAAVLLGAGIMIVASYIRHLKGD